MREEPALIRALLDTGVEVAVYDREGLDQARKMLEEVVFCEDEYACAVGADAVIIATEWEQFRALDLPASRSSSANVLLSIQEISTRLTRCVTKVSPVFCVGVRRGDIG